MTADLRSTDAADRRNAAITRAVVFGVVAAVTWWFWTSTASADEAADTETVETVDAADVAAPEVAAVADDAAAPADVDLVEAIEAVVAPVTPSAPVAPTVPGAPALPDVLATARTTVDQAVDATLTQAVAPVLDPIVDSVVTPIVTPVVQAVTTPVYQAVVEDLLPETSDPDLTYSDVAAEVDAPVAPTTPAAPVGGPAAPVVEQTAPAARQATSTRSTEVAAPLPAPGPTPASGDTQDLPDPRPVSHLPLASGAPASVPGTSGPGGRDVPDRAQGDMADAVAHVRAAASDMRALLVPKVVGASVNAGSRPAVTPD